LSCCSVTFYFTYSFTMQINDWLIDWKDLVIIMLLPPDSVREDYVLGLSVRPSVRPSVRLSSQILLPWYFVKGLNNFDKSDREYSLVPANDMTWLDSGGQRSRSRQAIDVKPCEHHDLSNLKESYTAALVALPFGGWLLWVQGLGSDHSTERGAFKGDICYPIITCLHRQDQNNGERRYSVPHTYSEWATGAGGYVPVPWVPDYRRWWVYDGIPYQVIQGAGDRGITAENIEKSQHTDFYEETSESASVACNNVRLWKLNSQKEWRNTSWCLWYERAEKDVVGFVDSKENKRVGS